MRQQHDLDRVRTLLTRGFSDLDLRAFCHDTDAFRPVYDELSRGMGKAEVVGRLLDHAESQMLIDDLLAWAKKKNPRRYELHGPYVAGPEDGEPAEQEIEELAAIRILFLAANPTDTVRLRLDAEVRSIKEALRGSEFRDQFDLEQEWAVRVTDLQRCLMEHKPHVVHFSGHGLAEDGAGSAYPARIVLEDSQGYRYEVPPDALSDLFGLLKDNIRCVVLNACYSEGQARAIAEQIDCVIGMSTAISDRAAIQFSAAFYQALGFGRDVETAFKLACNQLDLQSIAEADTPKLIATRCDPRTVVLGRGAPGP